MVKPLRAPKLEAISNITHGFFTRQGGVSEGIYASLNCGFGSQDDNANVAENRKRIANVLGVPPENLITPYQEHTADAVIATTAWTRKNAPVADAVVTNVKGLAVAILTADCGPILFADPKAGVVAAAHSGWRGAKTGIIKSTINKMEELGAKRANITAAVGPSLSVDAYEVGPEFVESFIADSPSNEAFFLKDPGVNPHFDLNAYIHHQLKQLGVTSADILQSCTYNGESLFYSYRRSVHKEEGDYGRQLSAIVLR